MSLTTCRECGTAVPANSHACPTCGATMAPVSYGAYRPAPPRPPEPQRPWWRTVGGWGSAAGWVLILGVLALVGVGFVRGSAAAGQRKVEKAEVAREEEHMRKVFVWMQDTLTWESVPDSGRRAVPTTDKAKRLWAISQMLVDRRAWERQVMERHGVRTYKPPVDMATVRYQANARDFPAMGRWLEGRAAAIAEIEKTSAAWVEERTAAMARESGMPAREIRDLFPPEFGGRAADDSQHVNAILEFHRHHVRVDPRVRPGGGDMLSWQREEDAQRANDLANAVNTAASFARQAKQHRLVREKAAFSRVIQVTGY
jgi:hypothetical protein